MELSQRFVRKHLERIHPFTKACSLEATRRGQDLLGNVLAKTMRTNVNIVPVDHPKLSGNVEPCACFAIPHRLRRAQRPGAGRSATTATTYRCCPRPSMRR